MDQHHFKGNDIPHIKLDPDMSIEDLVEIYSKSGFNGRKLGEAAKVYSKMINENATIAIRFISYILLNLSIICFDF